MSDVTIVLGLGMTGLSCVHYLKEQNKPVVVMDTRANPPYKNVVEQAYPDVPVYTEDMPITVLAQAQQILVSPGISLENAYLESAREQGIPILGDIELFARHNVLPVIAITGSNGKSTVTSLVGDMAREAGLRPAVVGNIGEPVLNILRQHAPRYDLVIMELSSFQLETTMGLKTVASTILNISPDHMDRYEDVAAYVAAKQRVYQQTAHAIINADDPLVNAFPMASPVSQTSFSLKEPLPGAFGVREHAGELWLAYGDENLMPIHDMKMRGMHNVANALSALALARAADIPIAACLRALTTFVGLPHRCQWVAAHNNVQWINDSKGTNIGATLAALEGLSPTVSGKIVLLLGGDGKGADFTELLPELQNTCRSVILMGQDAQKIADVLGGTVPYHQVENMHEAVSLASELALPEDMVLLSPACASTDQYQNYMHRGETFMDAVRTLLEKNSG